MGTLPEPIPPRDVQVRAVLPPEPYAQLMPGTVIAVGDLKHLGNNAWEVVTVGEIGQKVPMEHGKAFARLMMPDDCVAVLNTDAVGERDLVWTSETGSWDLAAKEYRGGSVQALYDALHTAEKGEGFRIYVCRPVEPVDDSGCENLPAHFRRLGVGEFVRRGDRWWFAGRWEKCPGAVGDCVRETQAMHFIRPMAMDARTWYVDLREGHGDDATGLGSHERPFASVEGAAKRIEATFKNPCGVLWDVRGVPIMAWDLPEPPAEPPSTVPEIDDFTSDAVLVQHRAAQGRAATAADEDAAVLAAAEERTEGAVIKNRLEGSPPPFQGLCAPPSGHRLLVRGETVGEGDLYRRPNMTHWAPVTSQPGLSIQVGLAVESLGEWLNGWVIYARPVDEHHLRQLAGPQCSTGPQGYSGEILAPVPDGWRELHVGEELRAGDLTWDTRWKSWYPVSNRDLRLEIQPQGPRACRVSVA